MKITVVGSGAWGTALALSLHKNGHEVTLWSHDEMKAQHIAQSRENPMLSGVRLPENMYITADPACVCGSGLVVVASPSFAVREVCRRIALYLDSDVTMVSVTKGIEPGTKYTMSQVVAEETGKCVVALTGPSHAEEVAASIPTGCLAACPDRQRAELVQDVFMSDAFRVYTSPDIVGAELSGALKNVIALCVGMVDGLGYGDNTKAMLMTRGLTEIARLGVSMGASKETFAGLAGVGDLIVTCTSEHSRNRRAGVLIGKGMTPKQAMETVGAVVEGYYAAATAWELGRQHGVDMPIVYGAYQVLYKGQRLQQVVDTLLHRSKKTEAEDVDWL